MAKNETNGRCTEIDFHLFQFLILDGNIKDENHTDPYSTSGVDLLATLSYRGVGGDKQYNQDEVDAIGSLCHVHSKPGRVHFML